MMRRRNDGGTALLIAVLIVGILSVSVAASWKHLHLTRAHGHTVRLHEEAQHLAEAGLEQAMAMLRVDPAYPGAKQVALGNGDYSVRVERTGVPGAYRLHAEGRVGAEGRIYRRLTGTLQLGPTGEVESYHWARERGRAP